MRNPDPKIARLCELFADLPGIGPRSAARIVEALSGRKRQTGQELCSVLQDVLATVHHCPCCNVSTTLPLCAICSDATRDQSIICVVESQADEEAIESTVAYNGLYFVLGGRLNPLEGVRPQDLGVERLIERAKSGKVAEVVIATSYTPDGEVTAQMLVNALHKYAPQVRVSRLARGLPSGVEVEFTDAATLASAVIDRHQA